MLRLLHVQFLSSDPYEWLCRVLDGREVYITRTPIDLTGGSTWDYLKKLAAETGLCASDGTNILAKSYRLVDVKRDNVPLAQYLGDKRKLATRSMPRQVYYPLVAMPAKRPRWRQPCAIR